MKINEGKPPLYQEDTNKRILNSLELLNGLDSDAAQATRLRHPQAEMIEKEWVSLTVFAHVYPKYPPVANKNIQNI